MNELIQALLHEYNIRFNSDILYSTSYFFEPLFFAITFLFYLFNSLLISSYLYKYAGQYYKNKMISHIDNIMLKTLSVTSLLSAAI